MKIIYRIIIMLGFGVPGLLLGALFASKSGAAQGAGLAGGAIVLFYAMIGALIAAGTGLFVGLKLSETALPRTAAVMGGVLVLFAAYATIRVRSQRMAQLDPPEAYVGIPSYTLTLERNELADPVLAKKMVVSSDERRWTSRLPDGRTCSAQATAASLRKASNAIEAFLKSTGGMVTCENEPDKFVTWQMDTESGPKQGRVGLNDACLPSKPEAQFLVFALQQVMMTSDAPVKCK